MISALNSFLSYEFFAWLEIGAFAYIFSLVFAFTLDRIDPPAAQGVTKESLAPIFEEPEPSPEPIAIAKTPKPTLSALIRSEVEAKGIRQLRAEVYRNGLQNAVKEVTGKSPSRCTVAEL